MNFNVGIPINPIQYQQPRCRPEICINCPRKHYCQHYTEFLETNVYMNTRPQMSSMQQFNGIQQPIIQQPVLQQPTVQQPIVRQSTIQQPIITQPTANEQEVTVQQPVVQQANVDFSPLLNIMEQMQSRIENLSQEINTIKSTPIKNTQKDVVKNNVKPIILPPPIIDNVINKSDVVSDVIVQEQVNEVANDKNPEVEVIEPEKGMVIYDAEPGTVLVQKKTIFGK